MNDIRDYRPTVLGGPIGGESPRVSSVNPLGRSYPVAEETACEHLNNALQIGAGLIELFGRKGLTALADDVKALTARIARSLQEIKNGNIGRPTK